MCHGEDKWICSEVGDDPALCNRTTLLKPPAWYATEALHQFAEVIRLASGGSIEESRGALATVRAGEMHDYLLEHGRETGLSRLRVQGIKRPKRPLVPVVKDPVRDPAKLANEVWKRDHYNCRYCGTPVIAPSVLIAYSRLIGSDTFWISRPVERRHGVVLAFRAYADHVVPHASGGRTTVKNLVTACWSCAYGKASYDIEMLKLDSPWDRPASESPWQGLIQYLPGLQALTRNKSRSK